MTFSITQTGNFNDIAAVIKGNTYTGTWDFLGDSNTVDLTCDDTSGVNCESVTLDIDTDGDNNDLKFYIGEDADAQNLVADFTITGDNSVLTNNIDGEDANVTVTMNNANSLASTSTNSDEGNAVTIDVNGNGDVNGHTLTLTIVGGGSTYDITQSGVYDNTIVASFTGDSHDVDITQVD
jgi:D-alanyl-D-alanine carboxypeptidase